MHRRVLLLVVLALLTLGLVGPALAQSDQRCFPETNQCISGVIRQYWERNGGLPVFGYPITALQTETIDTWSGPTQWFERDRLEDHTAQGQGVLAGRLGVERLAQLGTPWQHGQITGSVPGCIDFPAETGHQACFEFADYWRKNGGLERFGYPITDAFDTTVEGKTLTVQYFERRRMELHPENAAPYKVLLGLLGNEIRSNSGGTLAPAPTQPEPVPTPTPPAPVAAPGATGVCATNAPAPAEGAQAWMTVTNPARRSNTTLCVRLIVGGQPVVGATASGVAHYKSTNTDVGSATTGVDGVAGITFSVGGASSGFTVQVDATVTANGQSYRAQTSFTPE